MLPTSCNAQDTPPTPPPRIIQPQTLTVLHLYPHYLKQWPACIQQVLINDRDGRMKNCCHAVIIVV